MRVTALKQVTKAWKQPSTLQLRAWIGQNRTMFSDGKTNFYKYGTNIWEIPQFVLCMRLSVFLRVFFFYLVNTCLEKKARSFAIKFLK